MATEREPSSSAAHPRSLFPIVQKPCLSVSGWQAVSHDRLSGLVLRGFYTTCIRPVIEHSSVVWSSISSTDSVKLEQLNRKAARLISNTKCRSDTPHDILLLVRVCKNSHTGAIFSKFYLPIASYTRIFHRTSSKVFLAGSPIRLPSGLTSFACKKTLRLPRAHKNTFKRSPLYSVFPFGTPFLLLSWLLPLFNP